MKRTITILTLLFTVSSFAQNSQGFLEVGKLVANDREALEEFGNAVDISDGYAVVGNYKESEDENGIDSLHFAGAAYVFEMQGNGSWMQVQKLVNSDRAIDDEFGFSVAIDGEYIVVGARSEDEDNNFTNTMSSAGSAYVFKRNGSGLWVQIQKVVPAIRQNSLQWGWDVEINGSYMAIGVYRDNLDENNLNPLGGNTGSAHIFELNGSGVWVEVQKIVASDRASNEWFASDLDIDGERLMVGAQGANHQGKAYIFNRNVSGVWNETQILTASDIVSGSYFGESVSISGDYAVVGAQREEEDENDLNGINKAGAVYIYKKNGAGLWNQVQKIVASNRGSNDKFGLSVGIDSTVIVVGAIGAQTIVNSTTYNSGATYVFEIDNSLVWNEVEMVNYSDISTGDFFGENVAISGEYIVSSARFEDEDATGNNTLLTSGSAYVFKTCFSTTSSIVEEACASYTSPSGNYVWTSSNTYSDTIPNTKGCDSVITINLTILTATTGVDVVSSCNSYTWIDGNTYAVSNNSATFNIVGAAANGCDSLVTLDLTISPAIDSTIDNTLMPVLTANQTGATYQWVDCDNGNAPILLATNQSYTATVNGNYAVEITVGLCMVTSECESVTGVGIKERTNSVLSIYPNPSSGIVNISNARDLVTVSFIDVMGKIVYTTSKTTLIDISQLNSGLYFVKTISKNNNVTVHKLYLQ